MNPIILATSKPKTILVAIVIFGVCAFLVWIFLNSSYPMAEKLVLGKEVNRKLAAKETHQYTLLLHSRQYARIHLQAHRIRIEGAIYDITQQKVAEFDSVGQAQISFSILTENTKQFQLVLHPSEAVATPGSYQIKVEEIRPVKEQDSERIKAEMAFTAAEKLRREGKKEQYQVALAKYDEASKAWWSIGDKYEAVNALIQKGRTHFSLGEINRAAKDFRLALDTSCDNGDLLNIVKAANQLYAIPLFIGAFGETDATALRRDIEWVVALSQRLVDPIVKAQAMANLGEIESFSNSHRAILILEDVLQTFVANGDQGRQAETHWKIGRAQYYSDNYQEAIIAFQRALELFQGIGDRSGESLVLVYLGHVYSLIGEKQDALIYYQRALPLVEQIGDQFRKANLMSGLGFFYDELGDRKRALYYREESQKIYQNFGASARALLAEVYVGELNLSLGNYPAALEKLTHALKQFQELKDPRMEVKVIRDIGLVYEATAKPDTALAHYTKALALSQEGIDERWKAYLLTDIGRIYQKRGNYRLATARYQQALDFNLKTDDKIGQSQTRFHLAKLASDLGALSDAINQIGTAILFAESLRSKVSSQSLRTLYFASIHQAYELNIDVLMQQHQKRMLEDFAAEALTISERARARSLLDLLNEARHDIKQGVDPQLLEQEHSLLQTLKGKADRKMQLTGNKNKEAELAAVTKEVEDLSFQLDDVRSKIRATSPRYAALTQPQPLKAAEIQQLLDDDTMLLEYALGDERSYLWAVTRDSIDAYTLPNRATIEPLVHEVYQLMTAPPPREGETAAQWHQRNTQANELYWLRATKLSQMVLGPVAEKLGNKRLVVVGDGALQLLPFAALREPVAGGQWSVAGKSQSQPSATNYQPLIVNHEITSLPSASSLKLLREDRGKPAPPNGLLARWTRSLQSWFGHENKQASLYSVAVLADPVFGKEDKRMRGKEPNAAQLNQPQTRDVDLSDENVPLPRLIATREEAEEIQKAAGANAFLLRQGFEVNRGLLESDELNRYGVVHFATHGFWDSANPELSGIFLSRFDRQGNPLDGALRLSDIYNLKLPKELVVLSACETAVGKDIRGEGLIALTRGFMYAGAARVMASLWKVDDTATAEMMKIFYQHLLQDKMSPAAALRQAQITMWQKEPTKVPYNWAAFVLQGEYR